MFLGASWGWSSEVIDSGEPWNAGVGLIAGGVWGLAILFVGSWDISNKFLSWTAHLLVLATPGALIGAVRDGAVDGLDVFGSLVTGFFLVVLAEKAIEEGA